MSLAIAMRLVRSGHPTGEKAVTHKNIRHAIVCDCADCGEIVDITSLNGVDAFPDIDAEQRCPMCGKIVCESCFGDWDTIMTEGDDDGGKYVCVECGERLMAEEAKRKAIAPRTAPNASDHRAGASPAPPASPLLGADVLPEGKP